MLRLVRTSAITAFSRDLGTSVRNSSPAGSSAPELCETDGPGREAEAGDETTTDWAPVGPHEKAQTLVSGRSARQMKWITSGWPFISGQFFAANADQPPNDERIPGL